MVNSVNEPPRSIIKIYIESSITINYAFLTWNMYIHFSPYVTTLDESSSATPNDALFVVHWSPPLDPPG